jgi:prolipoprotein diacylglyceryltransferase
VSPLLAAIPSPSTNVIDLGPISIHVYGLCYAVALIAAVAMLRRRWEAQGGSRELVYDVALWSFPAGIIGGRLYFLATTPGEAIEAAESGAQASVALDAREAGLGAEHVQPAGGLIARALAAVD